MFKRLSSLRRRLLVTASVAALALGMGFAVAPTASAESAANDNTNEVLIDEARAQAYSDAMEQLPYSTDEAWTLTGGPHNWHGTGTPWNSVDFSGGTGIVRSAGSGTAYVPASCPNFVRVDHGDGINTSYYHLINISVSDGQTVEAGTALGEMSTAVGCGGSATGPHVHFSLWDTGGAAFDFSHEQMVPLEGLTIGSWEVLPSSENYSGCMRHVDTGEEACSPTGIVG